MILAGNAHKWTRLLLVGVMAMICFSALQAQRAYTFEYGSGETAGNGQVTLVVQQLWNPNKSSGIVVSENATLDFTKETAGKVTKGYIKLDFRNMVDTTNDLTELQFLEKNFKSNPESRLIFPQSSGITYLKKGGWGVSILFEVTQNTTYTIRGSFGVSTKPDAPAVTRVPINLSYTVTGLGVETVVVVEDTVEEGLSEEEILAEWEYAQRQNTPMAYRRFIGKVGTGEFVNQAKDLLTLEYKIERDKKRDDLFILAFYYPNLDNTPAGKGDVRVSKIEGLNGPIQEEPVIEWSKKGMGVILKDIFNPHEMTVADFAGRRIGPISLNASDARLEARVTESLDSLNVFITGGKAPYQMFFVMDDKGAADRLQFPGKISATTFGLSKQKLARQLKVTKEGEYSLELVDERGYSFALEDLKIYLVPPPLIPPWVQAIFGALAFVMLIIAFFVARRRRKKNQETEELLEALRSNKSQGVINILPKEFRVNAHGFWRDSAISRVILTREFIQDINSYFVGRQFERSTKVLGFVLGTIPHFSFETEQYDVQLEKFLLTNPFSPKDQESNWDVLKREMGRIAEYHSEQKIIGWIVMHWGQGDTLSEHEIKIHSEHFHELYQFVMKIDLIHGKLDTIFYSRKRNGVMNVSAEDRVSGASLLAWNQHFIESGKF